jgi:hypothetical protein
MIFFDLVKPHLAVERRGIAKNIQIHEEGGKVTTQDVCIEVIRNEFQKYEM